MCFYVNASSYGLSPCHVPPYSGLPATRQTFSEKSKPPRIVRCDCSLRRTEKSWPRARKGSQCCAGRAQTLASRARTRRHRWGVRVGTGGARVARDRRVACRGSHGRVKWRGRRHARRQRRVWVRRGHSRAVPASRNRGRRRDDGGEGETRTPQLRGPYPSAPLNLQLNPSPTGYGANLWLRASARPPWFWEAQLENPVSGQPQSLTVQSLTPSQAA